MSVVYEIVNVRTEFFKPSNGVKTSLITVPTGFRYAITAIRGCNSGGVSCTAAIIVDRGGTEYTLNDAMAISTGLPGEEEGAPLFLEAADILKYTPSSTNQHVAVTYGQVSKSQAAT